MCLLSPRTIQLPSSSKGERERFQAMEATLASQEDNKSWRNGKPRPARQREGSSWLLVFRERMQNLELLISNLIKADPHVSCGTQLKPHKVCLLHARRGYPHSCPTYPFSVTCPNWKYSCEAALEALLAVVLKHESSLHESTGVAMLTHST